MPSEKNLLVEVNVATNDGRQQENFTGYPIAPQRVLTARHGLLMQVPAAQKIIQVRWHHQLGKKRAWRKAKIAWENGRLDAAVLSCRFPPDLDDFGLIWDQKPDDTMDWYGDGIARAGDKDVETTGAFAFRGRVYSAADTAYRFTIGISDECAHPTWYAGASGMPVFVRHRVIGIAVTAGGPARARRFAASPAWRMLEDPKFRKAIGYDKREARRQGAYQAVERLLAADQATEFRRALGPRLGTDSREAPALTAALFGCEIEQALLALNDALVAVGPGAGDRYRALACQLLGEILPLRFDPGAIEGTAQRCDHPDTLCLTLPAGIETVAEVIMAGVRARPAVFRNLRNRNVDPIGRDALRTPPYTGFDADGTAFESNVHADLSNRLVADEAEFDAFMIDEILDPADREQRRRAGWGQDQLKQRVANEMRIRQERRRDPRRYYFLLDPEIVAVEANRLPALKNLKTDYPLLDFVVLAHAADQDAVNAESYRFRDLREILPSDEEKP